MNLKYLLDQYDIRVGGPEWFPFVGFIDSFQAELHGVSDSNADRNELLNAQEILLYKYLVNREHKLFPRLIAAELLSLLAIDERALGRVIRDMLERTQQRSDDDYFVVASLAAHLMSTIDEPTNLDAIFGPRNRNGALEMFSLTEKKERALAARDLLPMPPRLPDLHSIRTLEGMLPGDCLFRRQTRPEYGNPFRDFGHAGLYIGCIDPTADAGSCLNHIVIHVVSDKPACQLTTLHNFCNPGGIAEQFWGAYQADLTDSERSNLIATAFSFVNSCTYSFTNGYKNRSGKSFRCDGFVEYCYENSSPSISPLSYRSGLFEDDGWKTMNPKAMRNCFIRKIASDHAPCCNSRVP